MADSLEKKRQAAGELPKVLPRAPHPWIAAGSKEHTGDAPLPKSAPLPTDQPSRTPRRSFGVGEGD